MDILNIALQWARDEIFSSKFFIVAGVVFILISAGFWQLGKTEIARSYIVPFLVCGGLLLVIGSGLIYSNYSRLNSFVEAYNENEAEFVKVEIERTDRTITSTENIIYKCIPILIAIAALLIIFVDRPMWLSIFVTSIFFLVILLVVDSNSHRRLVDYHIALSEAQSL